MTVLLKLAAYTLAFLAALIIGGAFVFATVTWIADAVKGRRAGR